jgi:hypothetical protein
MKGINRFKISALASAVLCSGQVASGADSMKFTAQCKDVRVEAYRYDETPGISTTNEWSKNERFHQTWSIEYSGGKRARVDGKEAVVLVQSGPILIVAEPSASETAVSMWVYVIHRDIKQIAAVQVNGFDADALGRGIKARTVQLSCTFSG